MKAVTNFKVFSAQGSLFMEHEECHETVLDRDYSAGLTELLQAAADHRCPPLRERREDAD